MRAINIGLNREDVEAARKIAASGKPEGTYLVCDPFTGSGFSWLTVEAVNGRTKTDAYQTMEGAIRALLYDETAQD